MSGTTLSAAPACSVSITGGAATMFSGEFANLRADVTGATPLKFQWKVENQGRIIKDYDDSVYVTAAGRSAGRVESPFVPPTSMSPQDFARQNLAFYWQIDPKDPLRTITVTVTTSAGGTCTNSKDFTVQPGSTIDAQPEDFYVEKNHPVPGSGTSSALQQHDQWHAFFDWSTSSYNGKGNLFFTFHRLYLLHFDKWRALFDYPPITVWDPATPLPTGPDIDHVNRGSSFSSLALPSEFIAGPGGTPNPPSSSVRLSNGIPCEVADAPKSGSRFPANQDSLNDFEPNQRLLGCALTSPFHNDVHVAIDGDMRLTERSSTRSNILEMA